MFYSKNFNHPHSLLQILYPRIMHLPLLGNFMAPSSSGKRHYITEINFTVLTYGEHI